VFDPRAVAREGVIVDLDDLVRAQDVLPESQVAPQIRVGRRADGRRDQDQEHADANE
jgi:hypothetical protein